MVNFHLNRRTTVRPLALTADGPMGPVAICQSDKRRPRRPINEHLGRVGAKTVVT